MAFSTAFATAVIVMSWGTPSSSVRWWNHSVESVPELVPNPPVAHRYRATSVTTHGAHVVVRNPWRTYRIRLDDVVDIDAKRVGFSRCVQLVIVDAGSIDTVAIVALSHLDER